MNREGGKLNLGLLQRDRKMRPSLAEFFNDFEPGLGVRVEMPKNNQLLNTSSGVVRGSRPPVGKCSQGRTRPAGRGFSRHFMGRTVRRTNKKGSTPDVYTPP